MNLRLLLAFAVAVLPAPLLAREALRIEPADATHVVERSASATIPAYVFEASAASPIATLGRAETAESKALEDLATWNNGGNRPRRNGFARDLPAASAVTLDAGNSAPRGWMAAVEPSGERVFASRVRVDGAWRLRLHLAEVHLPAGARLLVYGAAGIAEPFGEEAIGPDGDLWTPSVGGEEITLEARLGAMALADAPAGFRLDRVMEILDLDATGSSYGTHVGPCVKDTACVAGHTFSALPSVRRAVALLGHVSQGKFSAECTGALVNDTDESTTLPYLLTANHCYETPGEVATLEAFFDDYRTTCHGAAPALDTLPRVLGASLVATSKQSDFTLVRLSKFPDNNRFLLGWDARPLADGATLHQVSHPTGLPQAYNEGTVVLHPPAATTCGNEGGRPLNDLTKFTYVQPTVGGTFVVSSGSPLMTDGGLVVGQLSDGCGPEPEDGCDYRNLCANGSFGATYAAVAPYLDPGGASTPPCVPDAETLCLSAGRFRVRTHWNSKDGQSGNGQAVALTADTGYFWFFNDANVEMVVKVLNACGAFQRYWVFAGGLTNVHVQMTVTDVLTAAERVYDNPQSTAFLPIQDTNAFESCP
ncbi:MAG: hypothetical protein ABI609_13980 [Acidobacteriota bacterium]